MTMEKKKSFILFADFMPAVSVLTDGQAGKLFKQIFAYVNGLEVSMPEDAAIAAMFVMFRTQIDRETEKWTEKSRKNREISHRRKYYTGASADDGKHRTISNDNVGHRTTSNDNVGHRTTSNDILNNNDSVNDNVSDNVTDNGTDIGTDNVTDSAGLEYSDSLMPGGEEHYSFDEIWRMYGKPSGNVVNLRERWNQLSETDKAAIFEYVPKYVASRPEVRYRKNFENFLSLRVWENEPLTITSVDYGNQTSHQPDEGRRQAAMQGAAELLRDILDGDERPTA